MTRPTVTSGARLGFRAGSSGPHAARTMMLADLRLLLEHVPPTATAADYAAAIGTGNVLGKASGRARALAWKHLRALYGLDPGNPIFRALRRLWPLSPPAQPLLALTAALARDPLLGGTLPFVLDKPLGAPAERAEMEAFLARTLPDRLSPATLRSTSQNVMATWTGAGLFTPGRRKVRSAPPASPEAVTLGLFLGHLQGRSGERLFTTAWMAIHGGVATPVEDLAREAARRGLLVYRRAGGVTEVRFPGYLEPEEERLLLEVGLVEA